MSRSTDPTNAKGAERKPPKRQSIDPASKSYLAAKTLEMEAKALELRKRGASYTQIAKTLKCSRSTAYDSVNRSLTTMRKEASESREEVIDIEIERLDALHTAMFAQAKKGNQGAIDRVLRIAERRAKLLGLDAPAKLEHAGNVTVNLIDD